MDKYNHPIFFGKNSYKELNNYLINTVSKIFILVDENTKNHCINHFFNSISLNEYNIIEIPSGEVNKNIFTCINIWKKLILHKADRNSCLINLGGGIISDIGGFAASTFKRGMNFINIPTTLLGMVDASLGGKTGINLEEIKNEIGMFNYPKFLIIDIQYLNTLSKRNLISGFAEIIKHALIYDKKLWNNIKNILLTHFSISSCNWEELIKKSINIKKDIVNKDPKETGIRKILNFGHTIGHAIETFFMKKKDALLHGEAIALGIICEAWISYKNNFLSIKEYNEIFLSIKDNYPLKKIKNIDLNKILLIMEHDKKNEHEKIFFSLLNGIGKSLYGYNINNNLIKNNLLELIKSIYN